MTDKNKGIVTIISFLFLSSIILEFLYIGGIKDANVASLIANVITVIFLVSLYLKDIKNNLKNLKKNYKRHFVTGLKYWLIGLSVMMISTLIINTLNNGIANNEEAIRDMIKTIPIYTLISTVIIAPIMEEFTFRKAIKPFFKDEVKYSIFCGIIFGMVHVIFSVETFIDYLYIVPYGIMGSMFALSYTKTKNIFTPIFFHMIHNFIFTGIQVIINFL